MTMDDKEKEMLHDIHSAVTGNQKLGHEGLVNGFKRHDAWIRKADLRIAAITGGVFVIALLIDLWLRSK